MQWPALMQRPTSKEAKASLHRLLHQPSGPDRVPGNWFPAQEIYFPGINNPIQYSTESPGQQFTSVHGLGLNVEAVRVQLDITSQDDIRFWAFSVSDNTKPITQ